MEGDGICGGGGGGDSSSGRSYSIRNNKTKQKKKQKTRISKNRQTLQFKYIPTNQIYIYVIYECCIYIYIIYI